MAAAALSPTAAQAQKPNSDYTTRLGDGCSAIAQRAYGDRRRVDLIHKANPSLGPLPHYLKPGTVLHLPPPEEAAAAPDARVTFVRNQVTVQAQASKKAAVNDPLFRTNRVTTADASSANVTFRDETQLRVGEESLVIILGDVLGAARREPAHATLVSGALQARLGELSGKRKVNVDTAGGARVTMAQGQARVDVDATKTTRLAVHGGSATLDASKRSVVVPTGFGSKAEEGKAPTPPRPLPAPPVWRAAPPEVVFADGDDRGNVTASFADGPTTPGATAVAAASFRVQLARDPKLDDLITNAVVPRTKTTIDARGLTPGTYYLRVAAIDDDKFEGPPGAVAMLVVVRASARETTPGRAALGVSPGDFVLCGADGSADPASLFDVDATVAHELSCRLSPHRAGVVMRGGDVPSAPGGTKVPELFQRFTATAAFAESHPAEARGVVAIELRSGTGATLSTEGITAIASNGVEITGVTREGTRALLGVRFPASPRPFFVTVRRGGGKAESNLLTVPAPDAPRRRADGTSGVADRGYEVGLGGGVGTLFTGHGGRQLTASTAYRMPLGSRVNFAVGPSVTLARFEPQVASADSYSPTPLGDTGSHFDAIVGVPLSLRLFPHAVVAPYATIAPEVGFQRATFATGTTRVTSSAALLGGRFALGGQSEIGPGWLFVEGAVRASGAVSKDPVAESLSGAGLELGYRLGW
ncbi:MAG: LysM peptidoglycan-binding domain-containing protein [Myxococcales bacterium]|nr:LysM peptidoglycan-binding domain-containing protein [Myxococcales bacterium]